MISFLPPSPNNSFYSGWKFTRKTPPFLICQQPLCFADSETIPRQFWKRGKGKFCRLEDCDKNLQRKKARPRQAGVQQSLEGIYKALEELHWEAQHSLLRSAWGRNEHDLSWPWQLCQRMWTTWQASRASEVAVSHLGHTALHSSTSGKLETLIFFLLASGSTLTPLAHHNRRSDIAHIFVYSSRFFTNTKPHSVCLWVCLYVSIYVCLCVCICLHMHTSVYMYVHLHMCTPVSVSLFLSVYMYTSTYIRWPDQHLISFSISSLPSYFFKFFFLIFLF